MSTGRPADKNYIPSSEVNVYNEIPPHIRLARNIPRICRGVWRGNVGDVTALAFVMDGNFVERYGKIMSRSSQKIKLLLVIVV